jgi:hypothetical protein
MREEWFLDHFLLLDLAGVNMACTLLEFGLMGAKYVTAPGKKIYSSADHSHLRPKSKLLPVRDRGIRLNLLGQISASRISILIVRKAVRIRCASSYDFELRTSN